MLRTIATPGSEATCTYCESRIFDHDPICVRDCEDDRGSPLYFRHYSCLAAHIDESALTVGDACEWNPDGSGCC